MKKIDIEDDIYEYLRRQTTFIGETASQILRRLLRLGSPTLSRPSIQNPRQPTASPSPEEPSDKREKPLGEFLKSAQFQSQRTSVGKFLSVLAFLHRENPEKFAVVESIQGRSRKYFAKSESELESSGTSVHPKRIPDSNYWVVTNNSSQSKRELLTDVFTLLGYRMGWIEYLLAEATVRG